MRYEDKLQKFKDWQDTLETETITPDEVKGFQEKLKEGDFYSLEQAEKLLDLE